MSTQSENQLTLPLRSQRTDYSLSSLMGLPTHIITFLFFITIASFQIVEIHFFELLQGDFHIHGDTTLLYFSVFLISATILLVVQHHLKTQEETEDREINF